MILLELNKSVFNLVFEKVERPMLRDPGGQGETERGKRREMETGEIKRKRRQVSGRKTKKILG